MKHYIALGDSISIDYYPAVDVQRRHAGRADSDELGAASLLHHNDNRLWPEFQRRDLVTMHPGIELQDLTADGATTRSLAMQLGRVTKSDEPTLVTITAGGNDLLGEIGSRGNPVAEIFGRLRESVERLLVLRPNSIVIVSTVYDPTDGTNRFPGSSQTLDKEAEWLRAYNDELRRFAASDPRLRLADIQKHFLGHGVSVPAKDRWYLEESIIEPNARGASEVRRVWLSVLTSSS